MTDVKRPVTFKLVREFKDVASLGDTLETLFKYAPASNETKLGEGSYGSVARFRNSLCVQDP